MKLPISISTDVSTQILSCSASLEGVREGLGEEFEGELASLLERISENPNVYPRSFGEIRKALLRRFSQNVFYAVEPQRVVILELRDARREPPDWKAMGYQSN
ncbi:MAG: hypothetical protein ACTHN5_15045 [Phycisphaerae bacterium]